MRVVRGGVLGAALLLSVPASAAEFGTPQNTCRLAGDTPEFADYQSIRALRGEVWTRFEHAAEVSKSGRAIRSLSPLFLWANETKISCAKVYGSLRRPTKWRKRPDFVMLQKCDCFYQRMTQYLGR